MKMHLSGSRARRGKKSRSSQLNDRNLGRVVQRVLEIEALETRLLLSGVGTGLHKKKVTFSDADGDKVTVHSRGGGALLRYHVEWSRFQQRGHRLNSHSRRHGPLRAFHHGQAREVQPSYEWCLRRNVFQCSGQRG